MAKGVLAPNVKTNDTGALFVLNHQQHGGIVPHSHQHSPVVSMRELIVSAVTEGAMLGAQKYAAKKQSNTSQFFKM